MTVQEATGVIVDRGRVRALRIARGLTQHELGRRTGLSCKTVGEMERGPQSSRLSTIRLVADVLEVDVADLLPCIGSARPLRDQVDELLDRDQADRGTTDFVLAAYLRACLSALDAEQARAAPATATSPIAAVAS